MIVAVNKDATLLIVFERFRSHGATVGANNVPMRKFVCESSQIGISV